jgi:adenylate kinase family enzyme
MLRLHITGPAGAGTTTLGEALGAALSIRHLDTDAFFWLPTDPPFSEIRPTANRRQLLGNAMTDAGSWVLSGSAMGWGDELLSNLDAVVYLYVPPEIRIPRLIARERARYGEAIAPGGRMHKQHVEFISWARGYENPEHAGRSRHKHEAWLATVGCHVLQLEGTVPVAALVDDVRAAVTLGG